MMRGILVALVLLAAALAGCAGTEPGGVVDPATDEPTATPTPSNPTGGGPTPTPRQDSPPAQTNSSSPPPGTSAPPADAPPAPAGPARAWPDLSSAKVRPGVRTYYGDFMCTSNFVFTSPDNATVYLGSAAHCYRNAKLGDPVNIADVATGTLAYSSWLTMGSDGGDETTGANAVCSIETDQTVCDYNDFALIRVDPESVPLVHPAMLHYGGPTTMAPSSDASPGAKVLTYGNTWLRQGIEASNRREGYVLDHAAPWTTTTYTATPGVLGDSGSGVLLGDGRALGILVTVHATPTPGANGVTSLDTALAYAEEKAGVRVRLATWDLLDPGILPA